MSRLLLLIVVFAVVYLLLRSYHRQMTRSEKPGEGEPDANAESAEDMVRCTHCGVHLPKHESLTSGGYYFCNEAHRRAYEDSTK